MRYSAFRADEDGAAVVEFALVLPVLLLIMWGIIEIGRAFYTINNAASAAREGARMGAVCPLPLQPGTGQPLMLASCITNIRARVALNFQPLGAPLDTSQVFVTPDVGIAVTGPITVRIDYPYEPLTPLDWRFPMTRSATFRYERGP
ncbi:MAG: pilus assembly protein [Gemmatimonadaceae bacterium]|nr:pilus assembly protein [Gemmatimonadaceae bacterium]